MSVTDLIAPAAKPRPQPPEAPRHLRLVGNEEYAAIQRRRRMRVGGVVLAASVIILLFAAVAMHVVLAQNQFRLSQVDTQAAAQQAQYQRLRLQVDRLEAPSRIIGTAEGRLGMAPPATATFLNPSSATSGPAGPARATGGPAPATPPAGWSTIKPQLVASP
jgi:cell division protein FtsL